MLVTVSIMTASLAFAQTKTVKGVITEQGTGEPLPGATVSIAGSTKGVIADVDLRNSGSEAY